MAEDSLYEKSDLSASPDEASKSDKRSVTSGREDIPAEARSETTASSDIDTSGYTGDPTQFGRPAGDPPRYILIAAETQPNSVGTSRVMVNRFVDEATQPGSSIAAAGYDVVTMAQDVTITSNIANNVTQSSTHIIITYTKSALPNEATPRTIRVTWQSGFTKDFVILLPGIWANNNNPLVSGSLSSTLLSSDTFTTNCDPDSEVQTYRNHGTYGPWPSLISNNYLEVFASRVVSNPYSGTMLDTLPEGQWVFMSGGTFSGNIVDQTFQLTASGSGTYNHFNLSHRQYFGLPNIANTNPASPAWWGQSNSARLGEPVPGPDEHEFHVIKLSYPYASHYDNELPWTGSTDSSGNLVNFGFASTTYSGQYLLDFWTNLQGYGVFGGYDSIYGGDGLGFSFRSYIMYSDNIPNCEREPRPIIDACADPNSMAYYQYSGTDCDGVSIPASVILDPTSVVFAPQSCCPSCINSNGDDISYSTQPLTINAQRSNPTTIGGSDGWINVTINDGGFGLLGQTAGLPTGNANYTYVLRNQNAADDMMSQAAGKAVSSGAVSSTAFTFGYNLSSSDNNNNGLLQSASGAGGTTTITTSAAQGYVPGGSDIGTATISEGLKAGCYDVFVFDSSSTVCLAQTTICLIDPPAISGCTDNSTPALNYNALATVSDNNSCHYCEQAYGTLVDGLDNIVAPVAYSAGNAFTISYPTHTTSTDSEIDINNIQASTQFQNYINNIVNASSIQNADYKIELYKWDTQTATGNSAWASTSLLTAFNAGTTQVGSTITTVGSTGWNGLLNSSTLGAGFTYGYYTIKVFVFDPDATVEIEQCYQLFDVIVPVPVCLDSGVATAQDGVIVTDTNLYFHDQAICDINNNFCCSSNFAPAINFDPCANFLYQAEAICDPNAEVLVYDLQFYDGGSWVSAGLTSTIGSLGTQIQTPYVLSIAMSAFVPYGNGDYRVQWTSSYSNSPDCTIHSNIQNVNLPIYGCMDSSLDAQGNPALNYDPNAICGLLCEWCQYGCMDPTASNYDPNATCDDGTCFNDVYGCTDVSANNYNPLATIDDGSCTYDPTGCTDPAAINYDPTAVVNDGSCIYCTDFTADDVTITTTTATGYVIPSGSGYYCGSNSDGCVHLNVSSTCLQWELITCTTYCGLSQSTTSWLTPGLYDTNTVINFCNLPSATFTFTIQDCNGCQVSFEVTVPTTGNSCGCTDPAASNYNASAQYDDGTCEYCGCTDENATNYNPGATCDDGSCVYTGGGGGCQPHPCIPTGIDQTLRNLKLCIADKGFDYYNKLVTGQSHDCSVMDNWKIILIHYLLSKIGLDCIYNCEDANTPSPSTAYQSCEDLWIEGGPTTGLNDPNVNTLTPPVGTTSTVTLFDPSGTGELTPGDIIKHHVSGNIWFFQGPGQSGTPTPVSVAGLDPENASGNISGYWAYCNDNMRYISNSNNINYIDNFINFANKFCKDCGNDPELLTGSSSNLAIPDIEQGIDGIDDLEI